MALNDFHPDDDAAHLIIRRVCKIPADVTLTNSRAFRHLLHYHTEGGTDLTDKEDDFLCEWVQQ